MSNSKTVPILLGVSLIASIGVYLAYRNRSKIKSIYYSTMATLQNKTWDYHTNNRINTLHPRIREKVTEFINRAEQELGIKLRITSALRTWDEQATLYNKGRSIPGKIVTWAGPGQSYHNYGLAFDVVEIKNGRAIWDNPRWSEIGRLGKRLGFEWGGDWTRKLDRPHFQMTFGKHHSQLAVLYRSGNKTGEYINIA